MRGDRWERLTNSLRRVPGAAVHAPRVTSQQREQSERLLSTVAGRQPAAHRMDDGNGHLYFVWGVSGLTDAEVDGDRWIMQ